MPPATTNDKIDLYKQHKDEYATPRKPAFVTVGPAKYLAVDGSGAPGGRVFQDRLGALYGMAYTAKFTSKFAGRDFTVSKLEALYGLGDQAGRDIADIAPDELKWRMLIRVPSFITERDLRRARATLREKGKEGEFDSVRLEEITEGRSVQVLHVGPYEEEKGTIEAMHAFAAEQGCIPHGAHHEVYLSDPRRVPPEKLRTILRQPVR